MENQNFKEGDVVFLKSGGPLMTVYEVTDEEIKCTWFNEKKEVMYQGFYPETLEVKPPENLMY